MDNKNIKYWIWLSRIKNVNCIQKEMLLNKYKTPERIWNLKEEELNEIKELDKNFIEEILKVDYRKNLDFYEKYILVF